MKQFGIKLTVLLISLMATAVVFTSCEDDEDENSNSSNNSFTVGGNTVELSSGILEYYGEWNSGVHNFDITVFSSGLDITNYSGSGNMIYIEAFTSSNTFNGGTFTFNDSVQAGTFDQGSAFVNYNFASDEVEAYYIITGGSITTSVDGNNYDITFNLKVKEANWADEEIFGEEMDLTGSYSGTLQYNDVSQKSFSNKNLMIKQ